ncbi:Uncharacterised protein [Mycobacteroides abscessus]|nr:Uncharacterised protein [Mycobacteroides abscessus]SHQ38957.1 Uncharacterised protein [Mycobacteroides abscessus subsp. abscessus]CPS50182.1 Uncharacterised protein [Mycobacteroides abscessus]CPS93974.1 Uncharacterised protein [Mycobacteroides abscessus]CPS94044.1 Uncharacterised protein [Mycobacteroides abscessus]
MSMSTEPTWLDAETSIKAIEKLTDLHVFMQDHPEFDAWGAEAGVAYRELAAPPHDERWRDARHKVCESAMYYVLACEMFGYSPTQEQLAVLAAMEDVALYKDHTRDGSGRMVDAGILNDRICDLIACTVMDRKL